MDRTTASPAAVVGTGMLGTAVARALLQHGHPTTVWNRSPAKHSALVSEGAVAAASVSDAVRATPVVLLCVSTYDVVEELLDRSGSAVAGRTIVNLSSGTPAGARVMAARVRRAGSEYLDAAAMSGTRLVGSPDALFLYSGSPDGFKASEPVLRALGKAHDLGTDPGLTSVFDTALFGVAWATLLGFHQGFALLGAEDIDPRAFAAVARDHLPFVGRLAVDHASQVVEATYPADDGTVAVHRAALGHLLATSRAQGVDTALVEALDQLLLATESHGHGDSGIASVAEVMRASRASS